MNTQRFQKIVWDYYKVNKRQFPWRTTTNPYYILLSELMLQQTQAERVLPKYKAFIKRFPTLSALKKARLEDVLLLWQGLGYNRRARYILDIARTNARIPKTYTELMTLRGVGPYTAAAVMNFAYNTATPMVETNIRTVYLHHYFKDKEGVDDKEIRTLVEKTIYTSDPKRWFNALMDYGTYLKAEVGIKNTQSAHYTKQSRFKGSDRELRGRLIRILLNEKRKTTSSLVKELGEEKMRIKKIIESLEVEGLVRKERRSFVLA